MGILDFVTLFKLVAQKRGRDSGINVELYGLSDGQVALGHGLSIPVKVLPRAPAGDTLLMVPGIEYGRLKRLLNDATLGWARIGDFVAASSASLGFSTGAFVLAQASVLNGQEAVTHRPFEAAFRQRYPGVTLKSGLEFVDGGKVGTAANPSGAICWLVRQLQMRGHQDVVEQCLALAQLNPALAANLWLADTFVFRQHSDELVARLQNFIDSHYAAEYALADLAKAMGTSDSSLKRRFKQATGIAIGKYYQIVRMARMKYLLIHSDAPVDNICFDIGYADPRFARRLFVALNGCNPKDFRQRSELG